MVFSEEGVECLFEPVEDQIEGGYLEVKRILFFPPEIRAHAPARSPRPARPAPPASTHHKAPPTIPNHLQSHTSPVQEIPSGTRNCAMHRK